MPSLRMAFLWAVKIFLDDSALEVVAWGPKGPIVIDRRTLQVIEQERTRATEP